MEQRLNFSVTSLDVNAKKVFVIIMGNVSQLLNAHRDRFGIKKDWNASVHKKESI